MQYGTRLCLLTLLVGCGESSPSAVDAMADAPDAAKAGPCWPIDGTTMAGTIQLGGGEGAFVPMPDNLPVVYGPQLGFHIPVHARISSMIPGNPADVLDPTNPRTRFRAFFEDTGLAINGVVCPIRLAYKQATATEHDLLRDSAVLFEIGLPEDQIFGRRVHVMVEVIDSSGKYAKDEKTITCQKPIGWP